MSIDDNTVSVCVWGPIIGMIVEFVLFGCWMVISALMDDIFPETIARLTNNEIILNKIDWIPYLLISLSTGIVVAIWNYNNIKPFTLITLVLSVGATFLFSALLAGMGGEDHRTTPPTTIPARQLLSMIFGAPSGVLLCSLYLMLSSS